MSLLSVGEIRKFKFSHPTNPKKSLIGVVVEVDELYNCYKIIELSGGVYTIPFGNVQGTVSISKEQRRIMLELAKQHLQLAYIHSEKRRLTNKEDEIRMDIDELIHKLKLQYSSENK